MIASGLCQDIPQLLLDGAIAELTIREDGLKRFIQFNETEHTVTVKSDKGGSQALAWVDDELPRNGTPTFRGSSHVTGLYLCNAGGEPLPPIYIFDTGAKDADGVQIKSGWAKGLLVVRGQYGKDSVGEYPSYVCVRTSGCTDEELFEQLIEQVIRPLYPNCAKDCVRDNDGKLIEGPIIIKGDGGQGRLQATWKNLKFR